MNTNSTQGSGADMNEQTPHEGRAMSEPTSYPTDQQRAREIAAQILERSIRGEGYIELIASAFAAIRADEYAVHEAIGANLIHQLRELRAERDDAPDMARQSVEDIVDAAIQARRSMVWSRQALIDLCESAAHWLSR